MPPSSDVSELERPTSRKRWWAALRPAELIPNLIIGVVLGGLIVTFAISLATLIYGTLLPEHLDRAIGLALFGTLAVGLLASLMGSHPGVVIHMQDAPAAILASAVTGIVAAVVAGGEAGGAANAGDTLPIFMTVAVTVALTTLVTGAVLLLFGLFRLGRMVRYLPFPVIGGFMAGTGWLLFSGGLSVMTSGNGSLSELLRAGSTANWLPGMAFAALLLYLSRAVQHYLIWPAAVVGAGAIFYVIAFAGGGDLDGWRANGYLLGPFPEADLAQGLAPADLALVHWPVVMAQLPTALTIAGISLLAVLLSSTAIEMTYDRRVDLNQELRTTGLGNLLAGTLGGQVGYHSLSLTALNARAGTGGRAPIVIALVVVAVALQFGAGLLDFVPTFLVGGLVAFLGMDFLYSWLVEEYRRLTNMEYAVVVVIVVLVGVAGFLAGVALGLFLTVVLFVVNYSRVDAVRHALSGAELHSRVRRDPEERRVVAEAGKDVLILQLQGFLFFGTANAVLERIQKRQEEGRLSAVILDFRRVTGVDASAAVALRRLLSRAVDPGGEAGAPGAGADGGGYRLYLTDLSAAVRADFARRGLADQLMEQVTVFPSLDGALEATEATALSRLSQLPRPDDGDRAPAAGPAAELSSEATSKADEPSDELSGEPADATAALAAALGPDVDATALTKYLTRIELAAAERLIRQGDPPDAVYFVASGRLSTWLRPQSGADTRLESMRTGSVVGEIGFFTGEPRSASVVADEPTVVYQLSRQALAKFSAAEPRKAMALTESLARLMAERIRHLMTAIEALQR